MSNQVPRVFITLCVGLSAACGGDVDYLDLSPDEAAAELAGVSCRTAFQCGVVEIDSDTEPCTASYRAAETEWSSRSECEAELAPFYADLFAGCAAANLSEDERSDLNECLSSNQGCYSEAELADLAAAVCSGGDWGPEACQRANVILGRCSTCAADPTDPACN